MPGEHSVSKLLGAMDPSLIDGEFVFLTFNDSLYGDHSELQPFAAVGESEGRTLLVPKWRADGRQIAYSSTFRGITLRVHSSLNAVGLTAAFSAELAKLGISANVLAGYFHDHIFVQSASADKALLALQTLAANHRRSRE